VAKDDGPRQQEIDCLFRDAVWVFSFDRAVAAAFEERIPDYMVPSALVVVDSMPMTPNGKIDRQALLVIDQQENEPAITFVAPRSANEILLAGIWGEVLGQKQIGIYDNFFDLGGHPCGNIGDVSAVPSSFK